MQKLSHEKEVSVYQVRKKGWKGSQWHCERPVRLSMLLQHGVQLGQWELQAVCAGSQMGERDYEAKGRQSDGPVLVVHRSGDSKDL